MGDDISRNLFYTWQIGKLCQNKICTYYEPWFSAFDNVEYIDKNELADEIRSDYTVWFVKNELTITPEYLENNFELKAVGSFKCDFNTFEVYLIQNNGYS